MFYIETKQRREAKNIEGCQTFSKVYGLDANNIDDACVAASKIRKTIDERTIVEWTIRQS